MNPSCYEVLLIPLGEGVSLRIEEESPRGAATGLLSTVPGLPVDWQAVPSPRRLDADASCDRPPLLHDPTAPERGLSALRLFELRDYYWELEFAGSSPRPRVTLTSSLAHSIDRDLWKARESHGRFRFVNYLGSAWVEATVAGLPPVRISFEVASPKLDYEQEYRSMVEAIGDECQQLLLEWGTPASLNLAADLAKQHQTLLEQFLFLRHVLGPERLDLYLETISRRPHSRLAQELDWRPAGSADPALFVSDPLRHGRDWRRVGHRLLPTSIQEERKFDSLNTPPNRFLKFALQSFRQLCETVLSAERGGRRAFAADDAVALEANSMLQSLETFLALPLFDEVGPLHRIPFDSTTLQRREGYREILLAWLMLDAAAQLDWPGREDAYDGTTRDVATLYEFWLYFVLVRAFRDQLGMEPEEDPLARVDDALPFCCRAEDGRLVINLKQREASFTRFRWRQNDRTLLVHFFYNRSFGRKGVGQRGSYSKTFRPDYSLVIIPAEFAGSTWRQAETLAEQSGRIAYLHFDAKYRGENLPGIFGVQEQEENNTEEQRLRAEGTAKNADLYKMHTYNDAIRRTVGSYVLYPGNDSMDEAGKNRFPRYHEIVPGIGAFALRPGKNGQLRAGLGAVCDFIDDILKHQLDRFTQSYRIDYWTHQSIREQPAPLAPVMPAFDFSAKPPKDTLLLLGFVRDEQGNEACRDASVFFCHAVEWRAGSPGEAGEPTSLDFDPFRCDLFVAYSQNTSSSWIAEVQQVRLITAEERALELAQPLERMKAAYYYRFQLQKIQVIARRNISNLVHRRPGKPIAKTLNEFAACPIIQPSDT